METTNFIRIRREQLGLSKKDLAYLCNVTSKTVTHWERCGIANCRITRICLLAEVLRVSIDELLEAA